MTAIPAMNTTWLIDVDPSVAPLPIIGWVHTTGINVVPLVLGHPGPLVTGEAFLLHTDQVFDPAVNELFADADVWRESVSDYTGYRPGAALPLLAIPTAAPAAAPAAPVTRAQPQVKEPVKSNEIVWGTKTFKSKSFWTFTPEGGDEFIFVVEGGAVVPKNADKITREDFYAKRKAGVVEKSGKPDDEPELPMTAPEPEDDDDDLV